MFWGYIVITGLLGFLSLVLFLFLGIESGHLPADRASGRLWKHGYEAAKTKEAETKVTMGDQFDEAGLRRSEYATTECRKHGLVSCHPCFLKSLLASYCEKVLSAGLTLNQEEALSSEEKADRTEARQALAIQLVRLKKLEYRTKELTN